MYGRPHVAPAPVRYGLGDVHAPPFPAAARADAGQTGAGHPRWARTGSTSPSGTASGRSCFATATRRSSRAATSSRSTATSRSWPSRSVANLPERCVVDGEVVIRGDGGLQFEALLQRIHPAASRVKMLAETTPASFVAWDLLALDDEDLRSTAQGERRARLETVLADATAPVHLTPATRDAATAEDWFHRFEGAGLDGVIAKPLDGLYLPGKRAMIKIKHARTADCVVAGFRWHKNGPGTMVGSLLLGLWDDAGKLNHVGVTASFTEARRRELVDELAPLREHALDGHPWAEWAEWAAAAEAAGQRLPGATSRWNAGKDLSWEPLRAERVVEVAYDHLQGDRFRHATTFRALASRPHARLLPLRPAGGHRAVRAGAHLRGRRPTIGPDDPRRTWAARPRPRSVPRALDRATLARQHLLARVTMPATQMVEHLVGMQAQVPENPYVALWSRLVDFQPAELSDAIEQRRAVRGGLMRGTLHLTTDDDYLAIWPLIRPVLERVLHGQSPFGRAMAGIDPAELMAAGRAWLDERPRTRAQLAPLMAERWPDHDGPSLAYALTYLLALVQVTPRGLWRRSGASAFTTVEAWLGRSVEPEPDIDALVMRYLAAFGPASVADIRAWSGIGGLREVVDRLRPQPPHRSATSAAASSSTCPTHRGRIPDTPAPVRYLPEYDNVLLGHADRSRFGTDERVAALFGERPIGLGAILVDGAVRGTWRVERDRQRARSMLHIRIAQSALPRRPARPWTTRASGCSTSWPPIARAATPFGSLAGE